MKSINNRYRDPRIRYELDEWSRKKTTEGHTITHKIKGKKSGDKNFNSDKIER